VDNPNNVPVVATFSPHGFLAATGGVEVSNKERVPVLILSVLVRGEEQFRWCLTPEALGGLERVIARFHEDCKRRYGDATFGT
jgi:hypothetical protein